MKNRVAIMTWHTYDNYGSVWQAFALREVLKKMGCEKVDLINYKPRVIKVPIFKRFKLKYFKRKFLNAKDVVKRGKKEIADSFSEFRKNNYTYTRECITKTDLYKLNNEYDKFIAGSDQIWSPNLFDENYFLEFVNSSDKKIAYAPSIGLSSITREFVGEKMAKLINDFGALSIREEKGAELINELCDKKAEVVLDPTLLLNKDEWNESCNLSDFLEKEYILVYCLGKNKKAKDIAKNFSKKYNKKVIIIPTQIRDYMEDNCYNASPLDFLKLIYNASLVITDSFHGTIFSMNFNVPFITLKRFKDDVNSQNSRIYNILKVTNAQARLYEDNLEDFIEDIQMDFEKINENIIQKRIKSKAFLEEACMKENIKIENNKITNICAGCGMCAIACPKNCIEIKKNDSGFYEYTINENECVKCGLCKKICAQIDNEKLKIDNMKLYSAYTKNTEVLKNSASGGIAYELSKLGIENGYEIIGCGYDYEGKIAKHIKIKTIEEIKLLSGSKYIQSYTRDAFEQIPKMDKGIIIGTPCQIASIDNYLKIKNIREKFILIDLICHGVPSYILWDKFLKEQSNVKEINFRDKCSGWHNKTFSVNKKKLSKDKNNCFYDFFNVGNVYNDACYECNYRMHSCADIRIGDFWGPKFEKNNVGVSMVITCTELGENFMKKLQETNRIILKEEECMDYFKVQQTINSVKPIYYDSLMKDLKNDSYTLNGLSKKYCKEYLKYKNLKKFLYFLHDKLGLNK